MPFDPTNLIKLLGKVWYLPVIGILALMLTLSKATNKSLRSDLENCRIKQQVNINSISALEIAVADQNKAARDLIAASVEREKVSQEERRKAEERERATLGRLSSLDAASKRAPQEGCESDPAVQGAKEDL